MRPKAQPLTQNETVALLFQSYLSRNEDNLSKRIGELNWPDNTLEILEERGWIKRLKNTSQPNFERVNEGNLHYYCDNKRHLVCLPYSIENLHEMARRLKIKRCWFHGDHYDIPQKRIEQITAKCTVVSSRKIVQIARGKPR